jgi:hypothetical protein
MEYDDRLVAVINHAGINGDIVQFVQFFIPGSDTGA